MVVLICAQMVAKKQSSLSSKDMVATNWRVLAKMPGKWAREESLMQLALDLSSAGTSCLVRDDKNNGMMWLVEKE